MKLRERYSSLCACHRIASDRDFAGSHEVNRTLLRRRSVMVEGNAVDSESFRELMIWFPRPSSRSAWNALAGERVARRRERPGVRDVSAFFLPDREPHEKFANHEHHNNRGFLYSIRPPTAALAVMRSFISSLEHGRRTGHLVYRWQSRDSRNEQRIGLFNPLGKIEHGLKIIERLTGKPLRAKC
jgi:hypothetical protein